MDEKALLQAISNMMDQKLQPINQRLDTIDDRLDTIDSKLESLEEDVKVTRSSVNLLLEWAEEPAFK